MVSDCDKFLTLAGVPNQQHATRPGTASRDPAADPETLGRSPTSRNADLELTKGDVSWQTSK